MLLQYRHYDFQLLGCRQRLVEKDMGFTAKLAVATCPAVKNFGPNSYPECFCVFDGFFQKVHRVCQHGKGSLFGRQRGTRIAACFFFALKSGTTDTTSTF